MNGVPGAFRLDHLSFHSHYPFNESGTKNQKGRENRFVRTYDDGHGDSVVDRPYGFAPTVNGT